MTEFQEKPSEKETREYWEKVLGTLEPKQWYREDLKSQAGLITVRVEGEELCPTIQFQPEKSNIELYPRLAEGWALARETYGDKDPDGLITAALFISPIPEWEGSSILDALTSDEAEEAWDQASALIVAGFPRYE